MSFYNDKWWKNVCSLTALEEKMLAWLRNRFWRPKTPLNKQEIFWHLMQPFNESTAFAYRRQHKAEIKDDLLYQQAVVILKSGNPVRAKLVCDEIGMQPPEYLLLQLGAEFAESSLKDSGADSRVARECYRWAEALRERSSQVSTGVTTPDFKPGFVTQEDIAGDASTRSTFFVYNLDDPDEVNQLCGTIIRKVPLNLDRNHYRLLEALFEMEEAMNSGDRHLRYMLKEIYLCGQG